MVVGFVYSWNFHGGWDDTIEKCRFNLQTTLFCTNSSVLPMCLSTSTVYHHAFLSHSFFDRQFVLQEEKFLNRIFIENSRQVNTSGIFITLSQKIICRLQSRGFGDCIGFRYMNESIFKNNISSKRNPETAKESTQYQSHSDSKPMWIEIIRRVIYKLLWDFQNTPPRFPHILEVSINSTHSISLFPSNINIWYMAVA